MDKIGELVSPSLIERIWPQIWPLIKNAVEFEKEEDILEDLKSERRFLVIVGDGVAILGFNRGITEIHYVGGKGLKNWKDQMLEAIKTAHEATKGRVIIALGSVGWKKYWPEFKDTKKTSFHIRGIKWVEF